MAGVIPQACQQDGALKRPRHRASEKLFAETECVAGLEYSSTERFAEVRSDLASDCQGGIGDGRRRGSSCKDDGVCIGPDS
jgi:hypothetical protein